MPGGRGGQAAFSYIACKTRAVFMCANPGIPNAVTQGRQRLSGFLRPAVLLFETTFRHPKRAG
jgi:hypothetical protein